jgi:nitroreductase
MPFEQPNPKQGNQSYSITIEGVVSPLPVPKSSLRMQLEDAINQRHSCRVLSSPDPAALAKLLWHACRVRKTGFDSWGRPWVSTPAPSAGGILASRVIVDPGLDVPWIYDPYRHAAVRLRAYQANSLGAARHEVRGMLPECNGSVLYIISNAIAIGTRYHHPESLQFRDSGATMMMLELCATSLGLGTCLLGHHGDYIVDALGLSKGEWLPMGAIAVGARGASGAALDG